MGFWGKPQNSNLFKNMALILKDALQKDHHAPLFSKTGMISAFITLLAFLIPLFIVTKTHNYWVNTAIYFEQPNVVHYGEVMVFVQTDT